MKNNLVSICFAAVVTLGISGCAVNVQPALNSSLGIDAFENMEKIDVQDVSIALYIDPKLRNLRVNQEIKSGNFSFDVGDAFSVKLIKGMAYKFKTIVLIDTPNYRGGEPVDALMRVELQDVDVTMDVTTGFSTVSTESYTKLSVRAEIRDFRENKIVWVGTTQAKQTGAHEEGGQMTYQEAGRGFALSIDKTIDKAIGSLIAQMTKSRNLNDYINRWEKQNESQRR